MCWCSSFQREGWTERERENGRNGWNNNSFLLARDFWLDIFVVKGCVEGVLFGDRDRSLRVIVSPVGNSFPLENILDALYFIIFLTKHDISWMTMKNSERRGGGGGKGK